MVAGGTLRMLGPMPATPHTTARAGATEAAEREFVGDAEWGFAALATGLVHTRYSWRKSASPSGPTQGSAHE